jgi:two-component system response regulator BaeR
MSHIVIVEDEAHLANLERDYLIASGHEVTVFNRGDEGFAWLKENLPDLVVLDLMLPGMNGLDICRELRKISEVPIVMTTAKVEEVDRLIGLELGADDYLCKPFSLRELVARVKTILRRMQVVSKAQEEQAHALSLSTDMAEATFGGNRVELTLVEANLLQLLMAHPRQIFSRDQIIDRIYDDRRVVSDRTIDSHIKKLRKKLQSLNGEHDYIHSVYGAGYRFHPVV